MKSKDQLKLKELQDNGYSIMRHSIYVDTFSHVYTNDDGRLWLESAVWDTPLDEISRNDIAVYKQIDW